MVYWIGKGKCHLLLQRWVEPQHSSHFQSESWHVAYTPSLHHCPYPISQAQMESPSTFQQKWNQYTDKGFVPHIITVRRCSLICRPSYCNIPFCRRPTRCRCLHYYPRSCWPFQPFNCSYFGLTPSKRLLVTFSEGVEQGFSTESLHNFRALAEV